MVEFPPQAPVVQEIVVTAARLPPGMGEGAYSVVQVSPAGLADAQRVDEVLTGTPGVSLFRRASSAVANPTTQGLSLRALAPSGAGRALVQLDGVPLNDPFGGWVIWSQLTPESLAGADIVRGAGAGPYGAGALTGVVRLTERAAGGAAEASIGSFEERRAAAALTADWGQATVFGAAGWEARDGYRPVAGSRAGPADTRLDVEARTGAARLDLPLAGARLSLRAGAYREDRGSGLDGARSRASGDVLSATWARAPQAPDWGWRLQAWRRTSDFQNTSVAVAPGRLSTTPANDQFGTPATGYGVNAALRRAMGAFETEVGVDARLAEGEVRERFRFMEADFTRERRAGGRTRIAGLYVETAWRDQDWLLTGGLRADAWATSDGRRREVDLQTGQPILDERPADRDGHVFTARIGARRELSRNLALRGAAYSGFRPPSLNELYRPFRVGNDITEANADLAPERLDGVEFGLSFSDARAELAATAFWNRLDKAITNVTVGVGPGTFPRAGFVPAGGVLRERQNAGRIDAWGLEFGGRRVLAPDLDLEFAGAYTYARVDGGSAAPQLTGLRPAQAPRLSASASLDWRIDPKWRLRTTAVYEGRRFDDDLNSRVLSPSVRIDLRAERRLTDKLNLFAAVENLADARIQTAKTGDGVESLAQPRGWRIGLSARF